VQQGVYAVAGRPLLRRAERVLTRNAEVARFVTDAGARPDRVEHLANGVDTALFHPVADAGGRAAARERFGLPADRVLVLFAGRLVPKKGFQLLLDAHGQDAGYDLVFAGDGDSAPLRGRAGVHHLGTLAPEELAELYRACDLFALPSTAEGFPLTVQEAMASGLPVLTTDEPGYAPYGLDRDQVRLLPRETAALRAALAELAADPARRAAMGRYSVAYARASFDWPGHAERLLAYYRGRGPAADG
jgi:glycosyltransferase involved in cell wall biosynthesis